MDKAQKAKELFMQGYNCSQAVLLAFLEDTGLDNEAAFKIASSFGGGMGRLREVCGAVSAIFMAAGLIYSKPGLTNSADKNEQYRLVRELADKFRAENGSIICKELLEGSGITAQKGGESEKRTEKYYKKRPCSELVFCAAKILEDYIVNNSPQA